MEMNRRFRCGRLMLTNHGFIKELGLAENGGTRMCQWPNDHMNFREVHYRLRNLFDLRHPRYKTELYDFRCRPLPVKDYRTFLEYMDKHGLSRRHTVIYLCTFEGNNRSQSGRITTSTNSLQRRPVSNQRNAQQHTSPMRIMPVMNHSRRTDYSFKDSGNCLMNRIRELINQNSIDQILLQLYEYICIIYGYVCSIIDPMHERLKRSNGELKTISPSELLFSANNLTHLDEICQSTTTLLELNRTTFGHIQLYTTIRQLFAQFSDQLKDLHKRWSSDTDQTNGTIPAGSSSSTCSPSPPLTNEKIYLFQHVLYHLKKVSDCLLSEHDSSFRTRLMAAIDQIETKRSTIDLSNEQSICATKAVILSIKEQVQDKVHELEQKRFVCESDMLVYQGCGKILVVIRHLFIALFSYQNRITALKGQDSFKPVRSTSDSDAVIVLSDDE